LMSAFHNVSRLDQRDIILLPYIQK